MPRILFNRIFWLQALTVVFLMAPLAYAAFSVWTIHVESQKKLDDIEPRYARLVGLIQRRADLTTYTAEAVQYMSRLSFPSTQEAAQTGNEAQQLIRTIFADNKLEIGSIQVLPAKENTHFDRIPISLRVEGEITGIQAALNALSAQSPAIWVDNFSIQTIGPVKPASTQRLGAQFNMSILRSRS